jgi:hypothetical protein
MISRIAILALVIVVCAVGSATAYAAGPDKDRVKNKDKEKAPVSLPDGDPSVALLLAVGGATTAGAIALTKRRERKSQQPH